MEPDRHVWSARAVVDTTPPEARGWPVVRPRDAGGVVPLPAALWAGLIDAAPGIRELRAQGWTVEEDTPVEWVLTAPGGMQLCHITVTPEPTERSARPAGLKKATPERRQ